MSEQQPVVEFTPPVKGVTLLGRAKDLADDMKSFFKKKGLIGVRGKGQQIDSEEPNEPKESGT